VEENTAMRIPSQTGRSALALHAVEHEVCYEQPLNERIRTFLRLEFLFKQAAHSLQGKTIWDSRQTLASLLEILNIFSRSDLKTEIMKELERHTANLARLEQTPGVDRRRLVEVLDELDELIDRLHGSNGQVGHQLKQNEFLNSIVQRSAIPGGTCDFDLPAYHYWLQQPADERVAVLSDWMDIFSATRQSIDLILRLTRQSAVPTRELAAAGFFQRALDVNLPCQMVRVYLPKDVPCYAEISGGRHRFTVRFLEQKHPTARPTQTERDIEFDLSCCVI
jgi:cell division protein ZapD